MPYTPRSTRFLGIEEFAGWRVKLYGICSDPAGPEALFVEQLREVGRKCLPDPAIAPRRYGVGFLTVHAAEAFNQILVDWWECENELRHRVFKSLPESPLDFVEITASGEAFCVWELRVLAHEREAWIRHALGPAEPDYEDYLEDTLATTE